MVTCVYACNPIDGGMTAALKGKSHRHCSMIQGDKIREDGDVCHLRGRFFVNHVPRGDEIIEAQATIERLVSGPDTPIREPALRGRMQGAKGVDKPAFQELRKAGSFFWGCAS